MADKNSIEAALEKRDKADFQAFLKLRELMKKINYDPGRKKLANIIAEYEGGETEEGLEFLKECDEIVQARDDANEEFMQAIKDNPIKVTVIKKA